MSNFYAITIKYIKAGYTVNCNELIEVYCDFIRFAKGIHKEYQFELDSMGRFHLHGLFSARKNLAINKFKKPYWHIYVKYLDTEEYYNNWVQYIHKDLRRNDDAVCDEIQNSYPFQSETIPKQIKDLYFSFK